MKRSCSNAWLCAVALLGCSGGDRQDAQKGAELARSAVVQPVPEPTDAPAAVKGRVLAYGRYGLVRDGRLLAHPDSSSGKLIQGAKLELLEQTDRIPIEQGAYFAFHYRISNVPASTRRLRLRRVLRHPVMTKPDGTTVEGSEYPIHVPVDSGSAFDMTGYAFNEDYEMVEGDWVFQLWDQEQLLIEQRFTTYHAEKAAPKGPSESVQASKKKRAANASAPPG